jgi:hypothetical protein
VAIDLNKPWLPLDEENATMLGGHLGVYQLGRADGTVVYIGYAGARSLFGLRSELLAQVGVATSFRVEVTHAYHTRYRELLMLHRARNGALPELNDAASGAPLGRLSPAS